MKTYILQLKCIWNNVELINGFHWRIRVSIPVPLACKASALPFELIPRIFFMDSFWGIQNSWEVQMNAKVNLMLSNWSLHHSDKVITVVDIFFYLACFLESANQAPYTHFDQEDKKWLFNICCLNDCLINKKIEIKKCIYSIRPRQDSNLESSDPKSDALSIRPRGHSCLNYKP